MSITNSQPSTPRLQNNPSEINGVAHQENANTSSLVENATASGMQSTSQHNDAAPDLNPPLIQTSNANQSPNIQPSQTQPQVSQVRSDSNDSEVSLQMEEQQPEEYQSEEQQQAQARSITPLTPRAFQALPPESRVQNLVRTTAQYCSTPLDSEQLDRLKAENMSTQQKTALNNVWNNGKSNTAYGTAVTSFNNAIQNNKSVSTLSSWTSSILGGRSYIDPSPFAQIINDKTVLDVIDDAIDNSQINQSRGGSATGSRVATAHELRAALLCGAHVIIRDSGTLCNTLGNLQKHTENVGVVQLMSSQRSSSHHPNGSNHRGIDMGNNFRHLLFGKTSEGNTYIQFESHSPWGFGSSISHMGSDGYLGHVQNSSYVQMGPRGQIVASEKDGNHYVLSPYQDNQVDNSAVEEEQVELELAPDDNIVPSDAVGPISNPDQNQNSDPEKSVSS